MKVTAFNGSPRANGNTAAALRLILADLEALGHSTQFVQVGGLPLRGCVSCGGCRRHRNNKCVIDGDDMNYLMAEMFSSDVIIFGSPTYFGSLTPEMKALIDRGGYVARANGNPLKHKIGASVAVARRAGANMTFSEMNMFMLINEMVIPGANYWNVSTAKDIGDFAKDEEGVKTMKNLAQNIHWLGERIID